MSESVSQAPQTPETPGSPAESHDIPVDLITGELTESVAAASSTVTASQQLVAPIAGASAGLPASPLAAPRAAASAATSSTTGCGTGNWSSASALSC